MPIPSIYLNLEDDVSKITARIKREKSDTLVLVCPKRCFLFNDSINLRLLKKQADMLGKEVFILTMDERGQAYATEAGFQLKYLPKVRPAGGLSDIKPAKPASIPLAAQEEAEGSGNVIAHTVANLASMVKSMAPKRASGDAPAAVKAAPVAAVRVENSIPIAMREIAPAPVTIPKLEVKDMVFPKEIDEAYKLKKRSSWNNRMAATLVALSLLLVLALNFAILPKAQVDIYPKSEPVTRDVEVSMSPAIKQADVGSLLLPAADINATLDAEDKFVTQGKREVGNKAAGTVRIYNFTNSPINLRAGTTVLSVGDKKYQLVQDISNLRPTAYKNAAAKEVDLGSLSDPVQVIAAEGGEGYNLPAGTRMEITNQVFGSKPQFLFAKTETPITGGTTRYLSLISDQDMQSSQAALGEQLIEKVNASLAQQGLVLAEKSYAIQPVNFTADKPVGTETPNFNAYLKAKIVGLAFNRKDMEKLISDRISQTLPTNTHLETSEGKLSYKLKSIDLNQNLAVVVVHFEGKAVYNINLGDVRAELTGKTKSQAAEILKSKAEVDQIDVTLAPSWQSSLPWLKNKIEINLK